MTTRRLFSVFSLLLLLALVVPSARADSQVRIVRLSLVDGPVQLDRSTGEGFERAIMNMPIAQGMQLWARGDSRAEVEFEEGNTIRVTPGSKVEFSDLILRSDGTRYSVMRIASGRVYVNFTHAGDEDFRIQFGDRELVLDHAAHFRLDVLDDRAEIAMFGGELNLEPGLRLKKKNTALVYFAGGDFQLAKGYSTELEDQWDEYRTSYHDEYARSAYRGSSFYGRSDLNYYGGWYSSAYGNCWRPYGFDASWDPYSSGAWVYYPGYGYTFVSLYPWGWQPFRSGAWYYGSGFGWCWTPNQRYYGYGWAPVYNLPAGYAPVQAPTLRAPNPRDRALGMIPVGNVNTTGNWKPTDPMSLDRAGRPARGERSGVGSGGVSGGGASAGASTYPTRTSRGDRSLNPPSGVDANQPRPDRGERPQRDIQQQRDFQREQQREIQREQRREIQREQRQSREVQRESRGERTYTPPPSPQPQVSAPPPPPPPPPAPSTPPPSHGGRPSVPK